MTQVEVEYCVPCGHRGHAMKVQEAILEEFGRGIDQVALKTGDGGVFKVRVDGELVFDKSEDEFSIDGIVESVRERRGATA